MNRPTKESPMTAAQMLHSRVKAGLQQLLADPKLSAKKRAALQARLDEVMAFERANPSVA